MGHFSDNAPRTPMVLVDKGFKPRLRSAHATHPGKPGVIDKYRLDNQLVLVTALTRACCSIHCPWYYHFLDDVCHPLAALG